jgi:hypothetical protein
MDDPRGSTYGSKSILHYGGYDFRAGALLRLVRIIMDWPVVIGDWSVAGSASLSLAALPFSG